MNSVVQFDFDCYIFYVLYYHNGARGGAVG
jgi:hypothetical protein